MATLVVNWDNRICVYAVTTTRPLLRSNYQSNYRYRDGLVPAVSRLG